jgi:hypothetical protein
MAAFALLALLGACGDDGDDDGGTPDAGTVLGEWRLTSVSGVSAPVNGTLLLDEASGVGGYVWLPVPGGRPEFVSLTGLVGTFTWDDAAGVLMLAGDSYNVELGAQLSLHAGNGTVYSYERLATTPVDTITLTGRATVEAGAPALDTPRVALIAMLRGTGGVGVKYYAVPSDVEPKIDVPAPADQTFTLARAEGALGVERIPFGTTGFITVNLIVAYEDRNHDGQLSRFDVDDCSATPGEDCIRGVAPVVLAARDGDSTELQNAGYGLMRHGWAVSALVDDQRSDGRTIVPLDPTTPVPVDVTFAANPAAVELPVLMF